MNRFGINGKQKSSGKLANPGSPEKWSLKWYVCVAHVYAVVQMSKSGIVDFSAPVIIAVIKQLEYIDEIKFLIYVCCLYASVGAAVCRITLMHASRL